jgi:hypothetical protein
VCRTTGFGANGVGSVAIPQRAGIAVAWATIRPQVFYASIAMPNWHRLVNRLKPSRKPESLKAQSRCKIRIKIHFNINNKQQQQRERTL